MSNSLAEFLPPVASWFSKAVGEPSPPQREGWPSIRAGRNTLILAPTGSGKTLAAFLAALDTLWRQPECTPGVRVLYISPLKALNEDIARNLESPLHGIVRESERMGTPLAPLRVAVRTGDTPAAERQRVVKRPPDILVTTPESLHLLLGSRARSVLGSVTHVIVDEIHALCPNKRGVFLSILLERLERLCPASFVRIGLSATQRPLDEVARFLGGLRKVQHRGKTVWEPRPVTIVDTGVRKDLDLEVAFPPIHAVGDGLSRSIWPAIEERLLDLIEGHRSTIVFANNRRLVERLTNRLNERLEHRQGEEARAPGLRSQPEPVRAEQGSESDESPARIQSHHGSLSLERRRGTETALKEGRLAAVVATASLELGIDMGAVDLVCQVESPGSVSRALQRVGRAGHLLGQLSRGRLFAKTKADLLESAALARLMIRGEVEPLSVPTLCLDLLAQQVVSCVAEGPWDAVALYELFRGAYPFRDLRADVFESVVAMVSGRLGLDFHRDLRPRISWDRVHNRLEPLPGTSSLALTGGGAIPDTGQFLVQLGENGPRLGQLDEEFVLERRIGDVFVLGTSAWKIEAIDPDRVLVSPGAGDAALIPFWRGETSTRTTDLGVEIGRLARTIRERLDDPELAGFLIQEYRLQPEAARALVGYIRRQSTHAGVVPDDRTILVEAFRDPAGEWMLAMLSPLGGRFHAALRLILVAMVRERLGLTVASIHGDDGILLRLPGIDEPPIDLLDRLTAARAELILREELDQSAAFGLRFRQNAARALLMPRPQPGKRTPLWLQRLRARDLLQIARQVPDFPVVTESLRECLVDDLHLPRLREVLQAVEAGDVVIKHRVGEIPSPFASELLLPFTTTYLYEWDDPAPKADRETNREQGRQGALLEALLDPHPRRDVLESDEAVEALERVDDRLRGLRVLPRSAAETAEWIRRLGDLAPSEVPEVVEPWLMELVHDGRVVRIALSGMAEPDRWVLAEDRDEYARAFATPEDDPDFEAIDRVLKRYLRTRALVGLNDIEARYPVARFDAIHVLESLEARGELIRLDDASEPSAAQWGNVEPLKEVRRLTLAGRRNDTRAVTPEAFVRFLLNRHAMDMADRVSGYEGLLDALERLQGWAAPAELWEHELLPIRVGSYRADWLDQALATGVWRWLGAASEGETLLAFLDRDFPIPGFSDVELESVDRTVLERLHTRGPAFVADLAFELGASPLDVYGALDRLMRAGRVANDRFDPARGGLASWRATLAEAGQARRTGSRTRLSRRSRPETASEGRWYGVARRDEDPTEVLASWASVLLDRYGVLARELVAMEAWAPTWRDLSEWLDRAEWRGEVRRGYFVEGLSGVQYAANDVPLALDGFRETKSGSNSGPILVHSADPILLYGGGRPFDVPLLSGGTVRIPKDKSTYVVLQDGRPVLLVEGLGRRLTWIGGVSEATRQTAIGCLRRLARPPKRVVKVESVDGEPAWKCASTASLAEAGFVRDPPAMTLYAGWSG